MNIYIIILFILYNVWNLTKLTTSDVKHKGIKATVLETTLFCIYFIKRTRIRYSYNSSVINQEHRKCYSHGLLCYSYILYFTKLADVNSPRENRVCASLCVFSLLPVVRGCGSVQILLNRSVRKFFPNYSVNCRPLHLMSSLVVFMSILVRSQLNPHLPFSRAPGVWVFLPCLYLFLLTSFLCDLPVSSDVHQHSR